MIDKNDVIAFFDMCAPTWDAEMICDDMKINTILDNAGVHQGVRVLDVGCGTGVLVPYYLRRGVSSVLGVDISPKMVGIAESKFSAGNVSFVCADAETEDLGSDFDCIVIYNAFPHFSDAGRLLDNLCRMLRAGGTLTVAHGMSRSRVNSHHSGSAKRVSNGLPEVEELARIFDGYLETTTMISDESIYQICGKKKILLKA